MHRLTLKLIITAVFAAALIGLSWYTTKSLTAPRAPQTISAPPGVVPVIILPER